MQLGELLGEGGAGGGGVGEVEEVGCEEITVRVEGPVGVGAGSERGDDVMEGI